MVFNCTGCHGLGLVVMGTAFFDNVKLSKGSEDTAVAVLVTLEPVRGKQTTRTVSMLIISTHHTQMSTNSTQMCTLMTICKWRKRTSVMTDQL